MALKSVEGLGCSLGRGVLSLYWLSAFDTQATQLPPSFLSISHAILSPNFIPSFSITCGGITIRIDFDVLLVDVAFDVTMPSGARLSISVLLLLAYNVHIGRLFLILSSVAFFVSICALLLGVEGF